MVPTKLGPSSEPWTSGRPGPLVRGGVHQRRLTGSEHPSLLISNGRAHANRDADDSRRLRRAQHCHAPSQHERGAQRQETRRSRSVANSEFVAMRPVGIELDLDKDTSRRTPLVEQADEHVDSRTALTVAAIF